MLWGYINKYLCIRQEHIKVNQVALWKVNGNLHFACPYVSTSLLRHLECVNLKRQTMTDVMKEKNTVYSRLQLATPLIQYYVHNFMICRFACVWVFRTTNYLTLFQFFVFVLKIGSHMSQSDFKLIMMPEMTLNSWTPKYK